MELKIHDQEVHLQRFWQGHGLRHGELVSLAGSKIEILSVGIQNQDAGPDFKNAVIKVDGQVLSGDIEIHLDSSGWYAHKHAADPAYNRVILHVISEATSDEPYIEREDGVRVHQVVLAYETASLKTDELDQTGPGRIDNCTLSKETTAMIINTVNVAAKHRLYEKVAQLREDLIWTSWDQLFFIRICEALGYSKNQKPFRKLAERLNYNQLLQVMQWVPEELAFKRCVALLFGTAGLLTERHFSNVVAGLTDSDLSDIWSHLCHTMDVKPLRAHEWQFFRLRPNNFPTRRLAGLTVLLHRFHKTGFVDGFVRIVKSNPVHKKRILTALQSAIVVKSDLEFGKRGHVASPVTRPALIGKERAKDILMNIVLPLLYLFFEVSKQGRLKNMILECYAHSPRLSDNTITNIMSEQLCVTGAKLPLFKTAYQQQGLIYLHKNFCRFLKCDTCLHLVKDSNFSV